MNKLGRNDPCWCKSGKKYKRCHLGTSEDSRRETLEAQFGTFGADSMQDTFLKIGNMHNSKKMDIKAFLERFEEEKKSGTRPKPSDKLILGKSKIQDRLRKSVIDVVGEIVDQNWCGRSEMCVMFAILIVDALKKLGRNPQIIIGKGTYINPKDIPNPFSWNHSWVVFEDEIIDGNVDSMAENPLVPENVEPNNYWGEIKELPQDRELIKGKEIDEDWIKENTTYNVLQEWRKQLDKKLVDLNI